MTKTLWTRLTLLCLVLLPLLSLPASAVPCVEDPLLGNIEVASDFPHLTFAPGAIVHQATVDLRKIELPLVSITNPSLDAAVTVEVQGRSRQGGVVRSHLIHIEPLGTSTISLELGKRLSSLAVLSAGAFNVEMSSARSSFTFDVPVVAEPLIASLKEDCGGPGGGGGPACSTRCSKDWTLTCASGGCSGLGPYTHHGEVRCSSANVADQVYWNLNTPTGSWTTIGDQSITATWTDIVNGCPTEVTNSLGHTYDITF